jgi:thymidylate synthase (FAD)
LEATLIEYMGSDLTVVNAARVSFNKESDWENAEWGHEDFEKPEYLSEKDTRLIKYLASHGHWTPFSHPQIMMREKVPIFVARQRFKHMVGFTYNEVSRRYVDDAPEFFTPDEWRARPDGSVKQGSGTEEIKTLKPDEWNMTCSPKTLYKDLIDHCERAYTWMIASGVAPEQARMILPQSMYTEYYTTGSLYAWARAYKQRSDPHAQKEIQDLAKQWGEIIEPLFPVSWPTLVK